MLEKRHAKSVKIVTSLDKEEGRVFDMKADYSGFKIPNAFVVGYGLDFNERYRQLPYIGILKEDCYKKYLGDFMGNKKGLLKSILPWLIVLMVISAAILFFNQS